MDSYVDGHRAGRCVGFAEGVRAGEIKGKQEGHKQGFDDGVNWLQKIMTETFGIRFE